MFAIVVWLVCVDCWNVGGCYFVRRLDVKFWEASLVRTTKFDGQVWRVLLPSMASRPNTALVMNVFTKEIKFCPAFPSPDESAADWKEDATGNYTVQVLRAEPIN